MSGPRVRPERVEVDAASRSLSHSRSFSLPRLSFALATPKRNRHCHHTSTELAFHHHHAIVQLLMHTARPSPPPPHRPTIALARAKVKAYGVVVIPAMAMEHGQAPSYHGQP